MDRDGNRHQHFDVDLYGHANTDRDGVAYRDWDLYAGANVYLFIYRDCVRHGYLDNHANVDQYGNGNWHRYGYCFELGNCHRSIGGPGWHSREDDDGYQCSHYPYGGRDQHGDMDW
jgi:hypothetical protein